MPRIDQDTDLFAAPPLDDRASTAANAIYLGSAQAFRVAAGVVSTLILVRYLSPADFGLVAMVGPILLLLALVQDLGLGQAMVLSRSVDAGQANLMFWLSVGLGTFLAGVMAASSGIVSDFYGQPELRDLVLAFAVAPALTSLGSMHAAVMSRRMRFKAIAIIESAGVAAGLAAAVVSALCGLGYWSMLASVLVTTLVTQAGFLLTCRWRPGKPRLGRGFGSIAGFGAGMSFANLLNFVHRNADNVILAKFLGAAELGVYDRAYKLMLLPIQQIIAPLGRIMTPYLVARSDRPNEYKGAYVLSVTCIMVAAHPALILATVASNDVATVLLGPKWVEVGDVFRWLGLCGIQQVLTSSFDWLLASQGRAKDSTFVAGVGLACAVGAAVAGLPWGVQGVALAYALADSLIRAPFHVAVLGRSGPVAASDIAAACLPHAAAILACGTLLWLAGAGRGGLSFLDLALLWAAAQAAYLAVIAAFPSKRRILAATLSLVPWTKLTNSFRKRLA